MITTDIDFPVGLPCPLKDGYDLNPIQTFERTNMGSGRARQRRLFSFVPTEANVQWHFSNAQAAAFEVWFRDKIHDGADWFNCVLKTPIGEMPYVCRFVRMYQGPTIIGQSSWRIRALLEIYERPIVPPPWGELPDWILRWSEFDVLMNWVWPLAASDNVTLLTETGKIIVLESSANVDPTGDSVKISQLPIAANLTGDEYIPLVQNGVTKRAKAVATADVPNPDADYLTYYESSKD